MTMASIRAGSVPANIRQVRAHAATDEIIIERIAAGDQLAMRTLFARHRTPIYRFAMRLLKSETAAEDVVSEVFLDVWRQAGRFQGRSTVSTWLLSIARFKAISAMRVTGTGARTSPTAVIRSTRNGIRLRLPS